MSGAGPAAPAPEGPVPLATALERLDADGRATFARRAAAPDDVALQAALGAVLARDLVASDDHPNVDDSALDGVACRAADAADATAASPVPLTLVGESAAGRPFEGRVEAGHAVRIQTGAAVPDGADAILRIEDVEVRGDTAWLAAPATPDAIRRRGQSVRAGDVTLSAGVRIDVGAIALAAAMGRATVPVVPPLRVGVVTGGDELVPPGAPLGPGDVYDANGPSLTALVRRAGAEPVVLPSLRDDDGDVEALLEALPPLDVLITCGGISMGRYDRVRDLLAREGRTVFRKVRLKPGGPATFAYVGNLPWLALPGNPVSSTVTFLLLARTWMDAAMGATAPAPAHRRLPAVAGEPLAAAGAKATLLRVRLAREGATLVATRTGNQNSGVVRSLHDADALALVPPDARLAAGDPVDVLPLDALLGRP